MKRNHIKRSEIFQKGKHNLRLFVVGDVEVMLDADLARVFETTTKRLNEAVKRHNDRFPKEFMRRLTGKEFGERTQRRP